MNEPVTFWTNTVFMVSGLSILLAWVLGWYGGKACGKSDNARSHYWTGFKHGYEAAIEEDDESESVEEGGE